MMMSLCHVVVTVLMAALPDAERDGVDAVRSWAHSRVEDAVHDFERSGVTRAASPAFWGDHVVYAIQVDRFNDGDATNNGYNVPQAERAVRDDARQRWNNVGSSRHGGDLLGIVQRLDYIKGLGATTLWVSPVFMHDGSYHGYCTTDLTRVDPGFGSNEGLREMVAQAHARGLRVVLDIVANHLCDAQTSYSSAPNHGECAAAHDRENWQDLPSSGAGQGMLAFADSFFPPLRNQNFYNRCGANPWDDTAGEGPAAVYGDFVATMFDYETRNRDWQRIFTDLHKFWIAYADVDGFRMDAAKHVTEDFIAYFSTETRRFAQTLGKDNFFIVGEVAAGEAWTGRRLGTMFSNPDNPSQHGVVPASLTRTLWEVKDTYRAHAAAPYPGLNSVYDFASSATARDVLLSARPAAALEDSYGSSWQRTLAAQNDTRLNWAMLEIHDWPRFIHTDPHNVWKSALGVAYLGVVPGMPVFHYGIEQGFNGDCHWDNLSVGDAADAVKQVCSGYDHALNRQDMFVTGPWKLGSSVPSVDALARIGDDTRQAPSTWENDPMLQRDHSVYRTAQRFLALRASCPALRRGSMVSRWADAQGAGVLAFSRVDNDHELLVVLNTQPTQRLIPAMGMPGTRWMGEVKNVLNGYDKADVRPGAQGPYIDFGGASIDGNSIKVFALPQQLSAWRPELEIHLCQL